MNGNKENAIEAKLKVFKFHEINRNKDKARSAKTWIISVDPTYFDEPVVVEKIEENEIKDYVEDEIESYDENKVTPNYEDFAFAPDGNGSGARSLAPRLQWIRRDLGATCACIRRGDYT